MGNSRGSSRETRTLQIYDRLHPVIRAALQNARFDWACGSFRRMYERSDKSPKEIVKYIEKLDRDHARKQARRVWGPDHPAAR